MLLDALRTGPVSAIGTMSGTSLDGVDAAVVITDGAEIVAFGRHAYRPYTSAEREVLRAAMGRWDDLGAAAAIVERAHVDLLGGITGVDLVGFHGQTTAHDPGGRGTCQIGDGRLLAHALDIPVVWDFRSADVAAGGQGAPLAPFFHHACARWIGAETPLAFVNLGGVGNVTWVDPRVASPAAPGACLAFDTGPANAPLNDLMHARRGLDLDAGGTLAAAGRPDTEVLDRLARQNFYGRLPPKSLDRDDFAWLGRAVEGLGDADAAATLTEAAALSVEMAMDHLPAGIERLLVTGGGRHNPVMMAALARRLDVPVAPVEAVGLDGDMLEAQAFGYLAVRAARGWPLSAPATTGVPRPTCGAIVSRPGDAAAMAAAARSGG